ncbi:PRC-barrel domain-containing protein [Fodinibius sediminis]|uniref:PRC-barrel domain-containing protein n=1 Tax=Fodinibius sediminis TaxID=1214077 RepID=A0A521D970_9BACT|nr:PRC-barrel domain-containing protein [Fodinibius sediminis]SMO68228.1 PRC-barrel domain-containing protein [Fodinibius sediminis]
MKPRTLSATSLTGTKVQNLQGENIGDIQDLMIDLETGQVLYVVLSFGGFMGMGDDYFAIPLEALVFSEKEEELVKIDIDKEALKNAPGFDKDNWPLTDEYVHSVYDYYGYERKTLSSRV